MTIDARAGSLLDLWFGDALRDPAQRAERCLELDDVVHRRRPVAGGRELVLVAEPPKRTASLLIDEPVRSVELGDLGFHLDDPPAFEHRDFVSLTYRRKTV